jgi:hypothetical protein
VQRKNGAGDWAAFGTRLGLICIATLATWAEKILF